MKLNNAETVSVGLYETSTGFPFSQNSLRTASLIFRKYGRTFSTPNASEAVRSLQ